MGHLLWSELPVWRPDAVDPEETDVAKESQARPVRQPLRVTIPVTEPVEPRRIEPKEKHRSLS